ncbi:hypothetical protein TNCV_1086641 [Trichonephila clavipes]|nr:hypothetical protein TNCV_1086641 [Trichonephila clavipes]
MFTDESRFALEPDDKRIRIWRKQGTRNHPQSIAEHYAFPGGSIMVWIPCSNCGGGDSWCSHLSSLRGFRQAKSYCHLYGAQGQRHAYLLPHATMNFVGLDLTTSDRWCCVSKPEAHQTRATT